MVYIRFKFLFNSNFIFMYVGEVLNQQIGREVALIYLIRLLGEELGGLKEEYSAGNKFLHILIIRLEALVEQVKQKSIF